jgi:hypothetical protein
MTTEHEHELEVDAQTLAELGYTQELHRGLFALPDRRRWYFWAGRLAGKNKRQWAWFVGWFNFRGEVAVMAAIDFGCATTCRPSTTHPWR